MARSWQLGPVLRGIRGHRAAAALVVVQLGIGLAITVLAVLMGNYFMHRNTVSLVGSPEDLSFVEVQQRMPGDANTVLTTIRATENCADAVVIAGLPLNALERDTDDVRRSPDARPVAAYELEVGPRFMTTSGLTLREGRDIVDADLDRRDATPAIVSAGLADTLWPGRDPLGARFLSRTHGPAVVIGVADPVRSYLLAGSPFSVVYARVDRAAHRVLLVRSARGQAAQLRTALVQRLRLPGHHATVRDAQEQVRAQFGSVQSVLGILATIVGTIVIVIFIGSMGLTYFLVTQRTREVGVRRALGATRRDVVRFFVVENILLTLAGTGLGVGIVFVALPRLFYEQQGFSVRWPFVVGPVVAVFVLNLFATLIPARKAATIPPVVASRSE